jgi:hypothetical protein
MAKRVTDKHPAHAKFERACLALQAEGVRFEFLGYRTLIQVDGVTYDLEDAEDDTHITSIPPVFECNLVLDR